MAAADPRNAEPATAPGAVRLDGVERVLRAGRQVPAFPADQRLQGPPVDVHGCLGLPGTSGVTDEGVAALSPRVAARSKWQRIEALLRNKCFVAAYRAARVAWLAGLPTVFPPGMPDWRVLRNSAFQWVGQEQTIRWVHVGSRETANRS